MSEAFTFEQMILVYSVIIIPIAVLMKLKLSLTRTIVEALVRMTAQLFLVGLYLKYIFELNHFAVNILWIFVMIVVSDFVTVKRSGLNRKVFFWPILWSIGISISTVASFFVLFVIKPTPMYDAQYLIPITGMLLGNTLSANIISLERFYSTIYKEREQHLIYLMLGAKLQEAVLPHFRSAVKAAVSPTIASIATIGVVSLPGMMTGQILGGAVPIVAIQYQIGIMICIFTVMTLSSYLNIRFTITRAFDDYGMLRDGIFDK